MFNLGFKCEPTGMGEGAIRQEIVGDLAAEALFGESSALYLKLYEEGVALVRRCASELDHAEQRVKILQRTLEGEIKPADFTTTDGE
jgi:exonuclease VII small subunit